MRAATAARRPSRQLPYRAQASRPAGDCDSVVQPVAGPCRGQASPPMLRPGLAAHMPRPDLAAHAVTPALALQGLGGGAGGGGAGHRHLCYRGARVPGRGGARQGCALRGGPQGAPVAMSRGGRGWGGARANGALLSGDRPIRAGMLAALSPHAGPPTHRPASVRGRVVESFELLLCAGMLAAALADAALQPLPGNWRWMVGAPVLPALFLSREALALRAGRGLAGGWPGAGTSPVCCAAGCHAGRMLSVARSSVAAWA